MVRRMPQHSLANSVATHTDGAVAQASTERAAIWHEHAAHVEEGVDLDALLDDFTKRGWLSEERFVEQTLRAKANDAEQKLKKNEVNDSNNSDRFTL